MRFPTCRAAQGLTTDLVPGVVALQSLGVPRASFDAHGLLRVCVRSVSLMTLTSPARYLAASAWWSLASHLPRTTFRRPAGSASRRHPTRPPVGRSLTVPAPGALLGVGLVFSERLVDLGIPRRAERGMPSSPELLRPFDTCRPRRCRRRWLPCHRHRSRTRFRPPSRSCRLDLRVRRSGRERPWDSDLQGPAFAGRSSSRSPSPSCRSTTSPLPFRGRTRQTGSPPGFLPGVGLLGRSTLRCACRAPFLTFVSLQSILHPEPALALVAEPPLTSFRSVTSLAAWITGSRESGRSNDPSRGRQLSWASSPFE